MKYWTVKFNRAEWAIPLFVRWIDSEYLTFAGVWVLCISVTYERWKA